MRELRWILVASLPLMLPARAWSNCERDLSDVKSFVPQIKDDKSRERAAYYVVRAERELDEGDEFDCQSAVAAVTKLIAPAPPASPVGKP